MNGLIIGAGKIGIDLYIKCRRIKYFKNLYIFNRNKESIGGKFCRKNNFNYSNDGILGLKKKNRKK